MLVQSQWLKLNVPLHTLASCQGQHFFNKSNMIDGVENVTQLCHPGAQHQTKPTEPAWPLDPLGVFMLPLVFSRAWRDCCNEGCSVVVVPPPSIEDV